jgi:hypothetical protein
MGAKFSTDLFYCDSTMSNDAHVFETNIITDSLGWTRISGTFIADSAYSIIAIGNFFADSVTDTLKFFTDFLDQSYYFLDDVCVSTDSIFTYTYSYTGFTENNLKNWISCCKLPHFQTG